MPRSARYLSLQALRFDLQYPALRGNLGERLIERRLANIGVPPDDADLFDHEPLYRLGRHRARGAGVGPAPLRSEANVIPVEPVPLLGPR